MVKKTPKHPQLKNHNTNTQNKIKSIFKIEQIFDLQFCFKTSKSLKFLTTTNNTLSLLK